MDAAARIARADEAVGTAFDRVFAPAANPWRHLGALAFLCFATCAATGLWLFALFDTSVAGAYESGRALDAGVSGRLVRGLHRYSADAFVLFTALHLLRELARGHFRAHRAWSWLSGLLLVPLGWVAGLTGFWLAWDERGLASAVATAEWLAAWPWGLAAFARNFASLGGVGDRFFSLVVFIHIGVPLLALAATWAHLQRLSHVRVWPPRALALPLLAALAALALAWPATSVGPAVALEEPAALAIDWFYLAPLVLVSRASPEALTIAVVAAGLALAVLPWALRGRRPAAAEVRLAHCNGCGRCAADCPFAAIEMAPRSDGRRHPREARVDPNLCAACGICAGACPTSTPLRRFLPVEPGIELPFARMAELQGALDRVLATAPGAPVVFTCARHPKAGEIALECTAMLPPTFVQYALRRGAPRVVVATCREGDCEHRLGDRWTRERLAGARAPRLRPSVPPDAVSVVARGRYEEVP